MASSLEENFLQACKNGNMMLLLLTIQQKVDINCSSGHGLRRAIRYNQKRVWQYLLSRPEIDVNVKNSHGQTALHTAARFNIPEAVADLLKSKKVDVNSKSALGSSPAMVAVKYVSQEALKVLVRDSRVILDSRDDKGRKMEEVVGFAALYVCEKKVQKDIENILQDAHMKHFTGCKPSSEFHLDEGYLTMSSTVTV